MSRLRKPNKVVLPTLDKTDNTVTEGYISNQQLIEEMSRAGKTTVSYIESIKNSMSEEDKKALKEQIADNQFREQLRKAVFESKDKIDTIYHKNRIAANINKASQNLQNAHKKYVEAYDKFEKESMKAEIERLKKPNEPIKNSQ